MDRVKVCVEGVNFDVILILLVHYDLHQLHATCYFDVLLLKSCKDCRQLFPYILNSKIDV